MLTYLQVHQEQMLKSTWKKLQILFWICLCMVIMYALNMVLNFHFLSYGIYPGRIESLPHIFTAPFLHGSLSHLINNLTGLAIFGWLCLMRGISAFIISSLIIITFSGLLVWQFGRPALHIGASGWIFGLWSLSIAMAWFDRRLKNVLLALVVAFFYGGMIYGVLPDNPRVSWEAHLFGATTGIIAAWILSLIKTTRRN
jgi:membrane associated rhomboid family serine protease